MHGALCRADCETACINRYYLGRVVDLVWHLSFLRILTRSATVLQQHHTTPELCLLQHLQKTCRRSQLHLCSCSAHAVWISMDEDGGGCLASTTPSCPTIGSCRHGKFRGHAGGGCLAIALEGLDEPFTSLCLQLVHTCQVHEAVQ